MRPLTPTSIRILEDIIRHNPTSQAAVARRLGLSGSAVKLHLLRLRRRGLIAWTPYKTGTLRALVSEVPQ